MSAGSELIPVSDFSKSKYADPSVMAEMSAGGGFLPRVMLMNATSELVQQEKMKQGSYALVRSKTSFEDLTKEVILVPLAWRPKALEIGGKDILSIFNPKASEFLRIAKKSEIPNSQCMYGPEYLCWLPSQSCFVSYYMASKTARRVSKEVEQLLGCGMLLRSNLIKGKQNSWYGPVISPYSGSVSPLPDSESTDRYLKDFNNPPEASAEAAEESGRAV